MAECTNERRDLGSGYEGELRYMDGVLMGIAILGPRGKGCSFPKAAYERCPGWVPVDSPDGWKLVSEDPLTVTPSIRCSCDSREAGKGQHGFITDGRWVNEGGIVDDGEEA